MEACSDPSQSRRDLAGNVVVGMARGPECDDGRRWIDTVLFFEGGLQRLELLNIHSEFSGALDGPFSFGHST
jgi:hypothetical protein